MMVNERRYYHGKGNITKTVHPSADGSRPNNTAVYVHEMLQIAGVDLDSFRSIEEGFGNYSCTEDVDITGQSTSSYDVGKFPCVWGLSFMFS